MSKDKVKSQKLKVKKGNRQQDLGNRGLTPDKKVKSQMGAKRTSRAVVSYRTRVAGSQKRE